MKVHRFLPLLLLLILNSCNPSNNQNRVETTNEISSDIIETYSLNKSMLLEIESYYVKEYGQDLRLEKNETDSMVSMVYYNIPEDDEGYEFPQISIEIPIKSNSNILTGDLNDDDIEDVIVTVYTEGGGGGGNVWWNDIFVFIKESNAYDLSVNTTNFNISGCDHGFIFLHEINNGVIKGTSSCYSETDGRCCPSLKYSVDLKIADNTFVVVNKKEELEQ